MKSTSTSSGQGPAHRLPIERAAVEVRNSEPVVVINGEPTFFATHLLRNYRKALGKNWAEGIRESVRRFSAHGIHRFETGVVSGWTGVDTFDPNADTGNGYPLDEVLRTIIDADNQAQLVLRIGCYMETKEWQAQHPDELARDQHGNVTTRFYPNTLGVSFASELGFAMVERMLTALVKHVEKSPWGGHVAGYNVYVQYEGMPWCSVASGAFSDYSPVMEQAWRGFLKRKYGTDQRLREAWGAVAAGLHTARVPSPDEHLGEDDRMVFHHPVKGRKARDYYELVDELVVKRHAQLARALKNACQGNKLVGFMGGYNQDAGEPREVMATDGLPRLQLHKQHFGGVGCWGKAFEIPEIDFYFAPLDYLDRGMGGVSLILNMPSSQKLHGKACWMEDDSRTHLYTVDIFNPWVRNARESVMVHRRNMALLYAEAGLSDWMEQISNWLLEPEILANLKVMNRLLQDAAAKPDRADAVCVLFDEESQGWTKPTVLLDEVLFYLQRNKGLSRCGVPVRYHLLSDLAHAEFPRYKFFILPNAWHWTPGKEAMLARVKRDGNVLLWLYGAGYVGENDLAPDGIERATGIRVACDPVVWEHRISITDFTHPITRQLPADLSFGTSRHYGPIFRVIDPAARELGRSFGNRMCRHVALAVKEFGKGARGAGAGPRGAGDYANVYCEAPDLPADLLREMARYAGCHVFLETNDSFLAGKDIIMVHAIKPGPRRIKLPGPARVLDLFEERVLTECANEFDFAVDKPGTWVLRVEPVAPSHGMD